MPAVGCNHEGYTWYALVGYEYCEEDGNDHDDNGGDRIFPISLPQLVGAILAQFLIDLLEKDIVFCFFGHRELRKALKEPSIHKFRG